MFPVGGGRGRGKNDKITKGHMETLRVTDMLIILIGVIVSQIYIVSKLIKLYTLIMHSSYMAIILQ